MPPSSSLESTGEDDEDRKTEEQHGFFDDAGCVAEIDHDEEWV